MSFETKQSFLVVTACFVLVACGTTQSPRSESPATNEKEAEGTPESESEDGGEAELSSLDRLSFNLCGVKASEIGLEESQSPEEKGKRLTTCDFFASDFAPNAILDSFVRGNGYGVHVPIINYSYDVLNPKSGSIEKFSYYYHRQECEEKERVEVTPWWDPSTRVKICRDDYRAKTFVDKQTGNTCSSYTTWARGSRLHSNCGCGPNLMFCLPEQLFGSLAAEKSQENRNIMRWVVENDRPLSDVLTVNSSQRSWLVESWYRRSEAVTKKDPMSLAGYSSWNSTEPLPRKELVGGQHAGVLTTLRSTFKSDARRAVLRNVLSQFACIEPGSTGHIDMQKVLDVGRKNASFRFGLEDDSWRRIAAVKECESCHAPMDSAVTFFPGYRAYYFSGDFVAPKKQRKESEFFLQSLRDSRGVGDPNPQTFGRLLGQTNEFRDCMIQRLGVGILGDSLESHIVEDMSATFQQNSSVRALAQVALRRHFESRKQQEVSKTATFEHSVEKYCLACHDRGDEIELTFPLDKRRVHKMMDVVLSGAMPKARILSRGERERFVEAGIRHIYPKSSSDEAKIARRAYLEAPTQAQSPFATLKNRPKFLPAARVVNGDWRWFRWLRLGVILDSLDICRDTASSLPFCLTQTIGQRFDLYTR